MKSPISPGGGKFKQIPTYKGVQRDRGRCDQGLSLSGAGKADPVLRLELDYELALLHEAMVENNPHLVDQCKSRLRELRREMIMLEAL